MINFINLKFLFYFIFKVLIYLYFKNFIFIKIIVHSFLPSFLIMCISI